MLRRTQLFVAAMSVMLWQEQLRTVYAQADDQTAGGDETPFSMICIADPGKTLGFNWINGDWKPTQFKPATYVINRVDRKLCHDQQPRDPRPLASNVTLPQACYDFKAMGQQGFGPRSCYEFWPGMPGKDLKQIVCDSPEEVRAVVDGPFVMAWTSPVTTEQEGDNKGSVVLTIGKCSLLNR